MDCVRAQDVQQGIETAQPFPHQGFVVKAPSAPDVVANPEMGDFIWMKTDGGYNSIGDIYYFDGSSWQIFALIDGSKLAIHSVTLDKLSLAGSHPFDIIQVDATGTQLIYLAIIDAIQDGTLPVVKLEAPDNSKYLAAADGGSFDAVSVQDFFDDFVVDGQILPGKITPSGVANSLRTWLNTNAAGTVVGWNFIDINNVAATGWLANQLAIRNSDNTAWIPYNPVAFRPVFFNAPFNVVNAGGASTWATYSLAAGSLAGHSMVIVQYQLRWDTSSDGAATIKGRKAPGSQEVIVGYTGGVDATAAGGQAMIELTTDGKFDWEVLAPGGAAVVTMDVIGYY